MTDLESKILRAATSGPHCITADTVSLYSDPGKPGNNALDQLVRRLVAAVEAPSETAEFQIYSGDEMYASTYGPREAAWAEAQNYANQIGVARIEEITRRVVLDESLPSQGEDRK